MFKKGQLLPRQGKGDHSNAGAPTKLERDKKAAIQKAVEKVLQKHAVKLAEKYCEKGLAGSDRVLIDAMNRNAPQEEGKGTGPISITFIKYSESEGNSERTITLNPTVEPLQLPRSGQEPEEAIVIERPEWLKKE
jgi:hypothetical protein